MWEMVELRELRVFLTLADDLHFGSTAERLGLTQSRVSQSLRELEAKVGGRLFHRTSRRVALTPLGARFLDEVGPAYAGLVAALERVHDAHRSLAGTLRLGLLGPMSGGPRLMEILDAVERRHPACEVSLVQVSFDDALGPLQRGEIDLMAARMPIDRPTLVVGPVLSTEPRVLAVGSGHPLAGRTEVSIEDVADQLVAPVTEEPAEMIGAFIPHTTPAGRPIRRLPNRPQTTHELIALVARGTIVHPTVPSFADYYGHPDVELVPIPDMPPSRTALLWHHQNDDPRRKAFVTIAEEVLG